MGGNPNIKIAQTYQTLKFWEFRDNIFLKKYIFSPTKLIGAINTID